MNPPTDTPPSELPKQDGAVSKRLGAAQEQAIFERESGLALADLTNLLNSKPVSDRIISTLLSGQLLACLEAFADAQFDIYDRTRTRILNANPGIDRKQLNGIVNKIELALGAKTTEKLTSIKTVKIKMSPGFSITGEWLNGEALKNEFEARKGQVIAERSLEASIGPIKMEFINEGLGVITRNFNHYSKYYDAVASIVDPENPTEEEKETLRVCVIAMRLPESLRKLADHIRLLKTSNVRKDEKGAADAAIFQMVSMYRALSVFSARLDIFDKQLGNENDYDHRVSNRRVIGMKKLMQSLSPDTIKSPEDFKAFVNSNDNPSGKVGILVEKGFVEEVEGLREYQSRLYKRFWDDPVYEKYVCAPRLPVTLDESGRSQVLGFNPDDILAKDPTTRITDNQITEGIVHIVRRNERVMELAKDNLYRVGGEIEVYKSNARGNLTERQLVGIGSLSEEKKEMILALYKLNQLLETIDKYTRHSKVYAKAKAIYKQKQKEALSALVRRVIVGRAPSGAQKNTDEGETN